MKPDKGSISNWCKVPCVWLCWPSNVGLGYAIYGKPKGHPTFLGWIRTSIVMVHDEKSGKIETENSRYYLDGPESSEALQRIKQLIGKK